MQHAIYAIDEVRILQICTSNFEEKEISRAKVLLYKTLGKTDRMPTRRRTEKGKKSLKDIIALLKKTDPDDLPSFVAKQLHRLPPITFNHVNITSILKDITALKSSLSDVIFRLEASEATINDLRAEVASLRSAPSESRSYEASNVNTRGEGQNASVGSFESACGSASPVSVTANESHCKASPSATRLSAPQPETSRVKSTPRRTYAAIAATTTAAAVPPLSKQLSEPKASGPHKPICEAAPVPRQKEIDEEGFIKVERKKQKKPSHRNKYSTKPTGLNRTYFQPADGTHVIWLEVSVPRSRVAWKTKV